MDSIVAAISCYLNANILDYHCLFLILIFNKIALSISIFGFVFLQNLLRNLFDIDHSRSLGCTTVEMLTGYPPWHEFEAMAAIFKIATSDTPKYELPKTVSSVARDFLKLCFRKQTERPSAEDLLQTRFCKDFT